MARRERLQVTGFPVHIIQRGNNRQACFFAEADHRFLLHHLGELAKRFKCELHAYAIGSSRFREEIEGALKLRATPNGPGRPSVGATL